MANGKNYYLNEPIDSSGMASVQNPAFAREDKGFEFRFPKWSWARPTLTGQFFDDKVTKYDSGATYAALANEEDPMDFNDVRDAQQGTMTKLGNALANNLLIFGATTISGSVGFVDGLFEMAAAGLMGDENWKSKIWDNATTRAMEKVQDWGRDKGTIFSGSRYERKNLWQRMGSANFWANNLQSLGFTEGMLLPGMAVGHLAKAAKLGKMAAQWIPSLTASIGEASTEAINKKNQKIEEKRVEAYGNYVRMMNGASTPEEKQMIEEAYQGALAQIEQDTTDSGNFVFLTNVALLTLSNAFQFGKVFERGFGTQNKIINSIIKGQSKREVATEAGGTLLNFGPEGGYRYIKPLENMARTAAKKIADGVSEFAEEFGQNVIQAATDNFQNYNKFNESMFSEEHQELANNALEAVVTAFSKSLHDTQALEEGMSGFFTGILGVPNIGGRYGIRLENNMLVEMAQARKESKEAAKLASRLNERIEAINEEMAKDPKINSYYTGLVRAMAIRDAKNQAVIDGDQKAYKDAQSAEFLNDIMMFDSAGDLATLRAIVENAVDMSDEGIQAMIEETTDEKGNGPFAKDGLYDSVGEVRVKMQEKQKELLGKIDSYSKAKRYYESKYPHLSEEGMKEALYLTQRMEDTRSRRDKLIDEHAEDMAIDHEAMDKVEFHKDGKGNWYAVINPKEDNGTKVKTLISEDAIDHVETDEHGREKPIIKAPKFSVLNKDNFLKFLSDPSSSLHFIVSALDNSSSEKSWAERNQLVKDMNDISKLTGDLLFMNLGLKAVLENKSKSSSKKDLLQKMKDRKAKKAADKVREDLENAENMAAFRETLENVKDKDAAARALESLAKEGNEKAVQHKKMQTYQKEVKKTLFSMGLPANIVNDAVTIFDRQYDGSENVGELGNFNSPAITNALDAITDAKTQEEAIERVNNAQYFLKQALSEVNKSNQFKDNFDDAVKKSDFDKKLEKMKKQQSHDEGKEGEEKEKQGKGKQEGEEKEKAGKPTEKAGSKREEEKKSEEKKGGGQKKTADNSATVPPSKSPKKAPQKKQAQPSENSPAIGNTSKEDVANANRETNDHQDKKQGGKGPKQYIQPIIPELHIDASRDDMDFGPFNEVAKKREGKNFDAIYNFLASKGAFSFLNSGKVKVGDTIHFIISQEWEDQVKDEPWHTGPTIFMAVKTKDGYQIIGSIADDANKLSEVPNLPALREAILDEYDVQENKGDEFVSKKHTSKVARMMRGKVPLVSEENNLKDVLYKKDGINEVKIFNDFTPKFALITKDGYVTNDSNIDPSMIEMIDSRDAKQGRLYLLIPNGTGKYTPMAVRVLHYNSKEGGQISESLQKKFNDAILSIADAVVNGADNVTGQKAELDKILYGGDIHMSVINTKYGKALAIERDVRNAKDMYVYEEITDKDGNRFNVKKKDRSYIYLAEKGEVVDKDVIQFVKSGNEKNAEAVATEIKKALLKLNLPFQVDANMLNKESYNEDIIKSGILTSNIKSPHILGTWFVADIFDENLNPKSAVIPQAWNDRSPIGGKEKVEKEERKASNKESKKDSKSMKEMDLEKLDEIYGKNVWEGENQIDGIALVPNTQRVINRKTGMYLLGRDAENFRKRLEERKRKAMPKAMQKIESLVASSPRNLEDINIVGNAGAYAEHVKSMIDMQNSTSSEEMQELAIKVLEYMERVTAMKGRKIFMNAPIKLSDGSYVVLDMVQANNAGFVVVHELNNIGNKKLALKRLEEKAAALEAVLGQKVETYVWNYNRRTKKVIQERHIASPAAVKVEKPAVQKAAPQRKPEVKKEDKSWGDNVVIFNDQSAELGESASKFDHDGKGELPKGNYIIKNIKGVEEVETGYMEYLGKIHGVDVFLTKEWDGMQYLYKYVLPNGYSQLALSTKEKEKDAEAVKKIREGLKGEKFKESLPKEAAQKTKLLEDIAKDNKINKPKDIPVADIRHVEMEESASQKLNDERDNTESKGIKPRRKRLREANEVKWDVWDEKKEMEWLERVLPQLSMEQRIRVVKGLIKVADTGEVAWGQFEDGIMTLSDIAATGTTYHEAFHVVFNMLLDSKEREGLLKDAREKFGDKDDLELEEAMAEAFREYVQFQENAGLTDRIKEFFRMLWDKVRFWNRHSMRNYFRNINNGKYARRALPIKGDYRELTKEQEEHPFAVFAVVKLPNGKYAATTRAADRGEAGKIGLPGGKVDRGESGRDAVMRKAKEEGWKIKSVGNIVASKMIDGKPVVWYVAEAANMLDDYAEMYGNHGLGERLAPPRVSPLEASVREISESGFGNGFIGEYDRFARRFSETENMMAMEETKSHPAKQLKPQYGGKLIYAQSGTGKSAIADNETVFDSDYLLGQILGVSTETAGFFFKTLSAAQKKAFGEQYRNLIREKLSEGKTVLTANNSMLDEADVVVYNQSAEQTEERINRADRAISNRYSALDYHKQTLDSINKLKENAKDKEYIVLDGEDYLAHHLLDSANTNRSLDKLERQSAPEGLRKQQDEIISSFLKEFGITVNHLDNYEGELPLFDALNRVINAKAPQDITDGVGYAIAFMMQGDPEMQSLIMKSHGLAGDFNRVFNIPGKGKRTAKNLRGALIFRQDVVREVGKEIAKELRNQYSENPSTTHTRNSSILSIIRNFFRKLTIKIVGYGNTVKKEKELFVRDIIEALGREDFTRIKGPLVKEGTLEKAEQVDVETAFKENPFEEEIISKLSDNGIALAGSASIALEGTLYRPSENPLHDIDFDAGNNSSKAKLDTLLPKIFGKDRISYSHKIGLENNGTITYVTFDRPFKTVWEETKEGRKVPKYYDMEGNYLGERVRGKTIELKLAEGVKGKILDFFVGKNKGSEYGTYKKEINGKEYLISHAKGAFAAKILWARPKDMWDYKNFKRFEGWKDAINEAMQNVPSGKRVDTSGYIADSLKEAGGQAASLYEGERMKSLAELKVEAGVLKEISWGSLKHEERRMLEKAGITRGRFAALSRMEREQLVRCIGF